MKNPKELNSPILEYRFTGAIFGAGPSPYKLDGTVKHHLELYKAIDLEFVEDVNESLYVDDYVSGGDEKLEICGRKQKLQGRFQAGGFTLRKWCRSEKSIARKINSRLLTAKCRLAPLNKLTRPRLELTSGRTGAKLVNTVQKSFRKWKISSVTMWMDSMAAMYWIRNEGVLETICEQQGKRNSRACT